MIRAGFVAVILALGTTAPALAYIGPGAGISAIGTLLAIVFAALLAVVGFVWYPMKRALRGRKKPQSSTDTSFDAAGQPAEDTKT